MYFIIYYNICSAHVNIYIYVVPITSIYGIISQLLIKREKRL